MAKSTTQFVCQSCGSVYAKWAGKCDACGEWNTLSEEARAGTQTQHGKKLKGGQKIDVVPLQGSSQKEVRRISGNHEFDRVCGGGLVHGSALLIGGDPGIGKSTLLLQIMARLSTQFDCLYISGEESIDQIRLRAKRLGVDQSPLQLAATTNVRDILASLDTPQAPKVVVIDSIQTMYVEAIESAPGTVSQVRAAAQELIRLAKLRGFSLILVGHVTKEGSIAGPKVLEHMVDTVLYFEGDSSFQFRLLRSVKNRYGPANEVGVFEMVADGLQEVSNPSSLFLSDRSTHVSGTAVFAGVEGTRPMLVEVQALVSPSPHGMPRRTVVGWDSNRLAMVAAVLETRCGLQFSGQDIFLNVAGGLRLTEPAADLAVAAALVSSMLDVPLPQQAVVFGEIGLTGEIRAVSQADSRLKESAKLGFQTAILPGSARKKTDPVDGMKLVPLSALYDLVGFLRHHAQLLKGVA